MHAPFRPLLLSLTLAMLSLPAFAALPTGARAPAIRADAYLAGAPFTFRLSEALRHGPVVVYFFPAAHTAGCNVQAHLFSEAMDDFTAAGATVIGITAGNTDQLAAFSKESEHCSGKFPVAADPGARIARQYDALLTLKPGWSNRTTYVIGRDGRIRMAYSDLKPQEHVTRALAAVRALNAAAATP